MELLTEDAQKLLELLPDTGRITNATAMSVSGWDYDRVRKAKFELREKGLVEIKAAFGGPFGKISNIPLTEPTVKVSASLENELYDPFKNWVSEELLPDDFVKGKDLFEVLITANKRPHNSGLWEVPDLISISFKKYRYIPDIVMHTISFEVKKKADAFNPQGIFEAISHSKFGSQTYYCFEWAASDGFYENAQYQRIEQEAKTHGIGLIRIYFADTEKKYIKGDIILEAKQLKYDPATLSSFIDRFFPEDIKNRIALLTNSW